MRPRRAGSARATSKTRSLAQARASAWFEATSCAHFNPARLNAFDADVTVIVCVGG